MRFTEGPFAALIAACLFFGAVASVGAVKKVPGEPPLHIYVPGSYSGIMPFQADDIHKAVTAFIAETNDAGGLLGRRLEIVAQDDRADLQLAEKNARVALADADHFVSVGHPFSSFAFPIGKLYNTHGKMLMSPYATSDKVSEIGGTVFQLCFNDAFQAKTLATIALKRLKAKRIFVLRNESDVYSEGLARLFLEALDAKKPNTPFVVDQYRYLFDRLNTQQLAARIRDFKPDLVFLPELKIRAAEIVRQLAANGLSDVMLLGADGWGSENDGTLDIFFHAAKKSTAGYYLYTYHWYQTVPNPLNKALLATLKKFNTNPPYGSGVFTLEALRELRKLAEANKTFDNRVMAGKLRGRRYEGATGPVYFRKDGTTERPIVLLRVAPDGLHLDSIVTPEK